MTDWIIHFIEAHGYAGIALLMLLENVFPPIPSELIMPFAGFAAARGDLHPVGAVLAGACGSLLGTLPWYWAGRSIGRERLRGWAERHGRWLAVSPQEIDRAQAWFDRRGRIVVLLGRLVPGLRSVISAPAGMARMPVASYLAWTLAGAAVWSGLLVGVGFALEDRYDRLSHGLEWVARVVVGGALALYAWRVLTYRRRG